MTKSKNTGVGWRLTFLFQNDCAMEAYQEEGSVLVATEYEGQTCHLSSGSCQLCSSKGNYWEFLLPEVYEGEELPRWLIYSPIITLQILIKALWSEIYNTATLTLGFQNNQGVFSGVFS